MTEKRLNNCLLIYIHKQLTDNCDLIEVAKQFCVVSDERRKIWVHLNSYIFVHHT